MAKLTALIDFGVAYPVEYFGAGNCCQSQDHRIS